MINVSFILAGLTDWIIIDCPLSRNLSSFKRKDFLNQRNEILKVVSGYINEELNPGKRNIYVPTRENYIEPNSIKEILSLKYSEDILQGS